MSQNLIAEIGRLGTLLEIAKDALREASGHFNAIQSGLTTDINKVEAATKHLAHTAWIEVNEALKQIDSNLLKRMRSDPYSKENVDKLVKEYDWRFKAMAEANKIIFEAIEILDDLPGLTERFTDLDAEMRNWIKEYSEYCDTGKDAK